MADRLVPAALGGNPTPAGAAAVLGPRPLLRCRPRSRNGKAACAAALPCHRGWVCECVRVRVLGERGGGGREAMRSPGTTAPRAGQLAGSWAREGGLPVRRMCGPGALSECGPACCAVKPCWVVTWPGEGLSFELTHSSETYAQHSQVIWLHKVLMAAGTAFELCPVDLL